MIDLTDKTITQIALRYALRFSDDLDIPAAFKIGESNTISEIDTNKLNGKRFLNQIDIWLKTFESILSSVNDNEKAWRYIKIMPKIDGESLTSCTDFVDFTKLLIKRRDTDTCSPDELGNLCLLHTEFQKKIKANINKE